MSTHPRAAGHALAGADPSGRPPSMPPNPAQPITAALGDVSDEEILVIASNGLDVTCDLIRRGARSVTLMRSGSRPEAQSATLVVIPEVPSLEWLTCVLGHAHRALLPTGRLVLRLRCAGRQLAAQVTRMLRVHGYTAVVARQAGNELLVNAQVATFGRQLHA